MTTSTTDSHLVDVGAGWRFWRWLLVRGAGFPAATVDRVASPCATAAASTILALEAVRQRARTAAVTDLRSRRSGGSQEQRNALDKAIKLLLRDLTPVLPTGVESADVRELAANDLALADAHAAFAAAFASDEDAANAALRAFAASPRAREAVIWQNRSLLSRSFDWILHHDDTSSSRAHQNYQTVARYMQRYAVKNDSAGFFGPIGFGRIDGATQAIEVIADPRFVDRRTVYFEYWCIDALARVLSADPEILAYACPRRMPYVRLEGATVHHPDGTHDELPPAYAALLAACDGARSAHDIATSLVAREELELADVEEVLGLLHELVDSKLCLWTLEIPTVTEWPERHLRSLVAAVPGAAGARAIAMLDEMNARRADVSAAAGDPPALERALGALDVTFERLTTQAAHRNEGKMYAARTLVYEDCRRALDLSLGEDLVRAMAPTLELFLLVARWFSFRIAEGYRVELEARFAKLAAGARRVDFLAYWQQLKDLFPSSGEVPTIIARVVDEMQTTWAEIVALGHRGEAGRIEHRSAADLAPEVRRRFAAPGPGWPEARYHSPDVMVAARSVEMLRRGERLFVLGEIHPSISTFAYADQKEHDEREAIVRARELDLPLSLARQVASKDTATHADHMWVSRQDIDVENGTTRSWRPRDQVAQVADLEVVQEEHGGLVVRDRSSQRSFDIIAYLGGYLTAQAGLEFHLFAPVPHRPRLQIDDFVVARETWRVTPGEIEFAAMARGPLQYLAARRWADGLGLPQHVFVKVPDEPKPVYIDLGSVTYVQMLAKLLRNATAATISEMLPTHQETWLPDAEGQTFTSELRLIAVDPQPWVRPASRSGSE